MLKNLNLSSAQYETRSSVKTDKSYSKKIVSISKNELISHKNFLKSEIKKNFY